MKYKFACPTDNVPLVDGRAKASWARLIRKVYEADPLSSKADFADCLVAHSAVAAGCKSVVTFDKRASKAEMTRLK